MLSGSELLLRPLVYFLASFLSSLSPFPSSPLPFSSPSLPPSLFPPLSPSLPSLSQERQECLKMAQSQEQELTSLQESLGQCRTELKAANIKNSELKRALDEITLQLKKRVPITHYSLVLRPHPTFRNFQYSDLSFAHVGQT